MSHSAKTRFDNLDLLKAIAMGMVVSLHIPVWGMEFPMESFFQTLPRYVFRLVMEGVPIFVMVNGFLMFHNGKLKLRKHFKKTAHLVLLLVVWSFFMIIGGMVLGGEAFSLETVFTYFFDTGVWAKYTGVLWFLQSLIGLYLVIPVLKVVYDTDYRCFKYLFGVVVFFTVGIHAVELLIDLLAMFVDKEVLSLIPEYLERFSVLEDGDFVLFAMLGGILRKEKNRIKKKRILFIVMGIAAWLLAIAYGVVLGQNNESLYSPSYNYGSIFMIFILAGWYAVTLSYQDRGKWYHKAIRSIGENTLGIYFLHIFVIAIVKILLPFESFGVHLVQWVLAFVASWMGAVIMKRIPVLKELVK